MERTREIRGCCYFCAGEEWRARHEKDSGEDRQWGPCCAVGRGLGELIGPLHPKNAAEARQRPAWAAEMSWGVLGCAGAVLGRRPVTVRLDAAITAGNYGL